MVVPRLHSFTQEECPQLKIYVVAKQYHLLYN